MSKHLLLRSCVLLSIFISRRNLLMEAPMATSCLNWTLNHSMHLSLAQLFRSTLVTVSSSSTATFQRSCSMTRKACTPCWHFSKCTVTRGRI
uniref:Secreted protein n=1 Tax=Salix viminalis TaxID=40686 RepID=A0A6N2LHZ9_SALVM